MAPHGADASNDLPRSHGSIFERMSRWWSRRFQRIAPRKVAASCAQRDHKLDLELEIVSIGRIGDGRTVLDDGVRWLLEEERRITLVAFLHLPDVLDIVPAYAVNPAHRKAYR
jgi:hypothetical protein